MRHPFVGNPDDLLQMANGPMQSDNHGVNDSKFMNLTEVKEKNIQSQAMD